MDELSVVYRKEYEIHCECISAFAARIEFALDLCTAFCLCFFEFVFVRISGKLHVHGSMVIFKLCQQENAFQLNSSYQIRVKSFFTYFFSAIACKCEKGHCHIPKLGVAFYILDP